MAKQLNIDLNVRANTQQAKNEFQALQKSLSDVIVQTGQVGKNTIDTTSLKQASAAAQELQRHLSNAVDVDTGKINLNKLNTSLKQSKTDIGELSGKLLSIGPAGEQAFLKLAQSVATAERPLISMGSRLNGLLTTFKNTARWQISSSILHGFMGAIQNAYGYAQDLNESLNNIRIVTGQTTDQMARFAKEANNAAKSLSTTTTEYTDAALIYYQQGLSDSEVKERTDATIKLANVSRQSAEEVSSQMTAIWNNFDDGTKSLEYYEDVITALGASTASSSSEISEGLQKFAAVADTVGLSYEKASAAVATVVAETRQSADVVGTAFKTMFARVQGLSLGETLEDGVDLNKYSKALQKVGVNILDSNGQLKAMDDILDELSEKWNNISEAQKTALAETVAGTRQYAQFMALMNNYDKVQKNQSIAEDSSGTLQKQADIYAESWEGARDRAKASVESIYQDLLKDDFFIEMTDGFAKLTDGLHNFIDGIGGLKGVIFSVGSLFLNYISNKIQPAFQNLVISLKTAFQTPAQQAQKYKEIMDSILNQTSKISNDNMTESLKQSFLYTDQLSNAKNRLMQVEKQLSESEKQEAQSQLNAIDLYAQEAQALADKVTQEQENINLLMETFNATSSIKELESLRIDELKKLQMAQEAAQSAYATDKTEKNRIAYEKAAEALKTYSNHTKDLVSDQELLSTALIRTYEQFLRSENGLDIFGETSLSIGTVLDGINEQLNKIGSQDNFKQMRTSLDFLKKDLNQLGLGDIPEVEDAFLKCFKAGNTKNLKKELENLKQVLNNTKIEGKDLKAILEKIGEGSQIKKLEEIYKSLGKNTNDLKTKQEQLNNAFKNFNPQHLMTAPEIFSKIAAAGMQASMVINSIRTIINAWTNEDMDPLEKFTTTLMSVGMIVPGVISSIQGISAVINGLRSATAAYNIIQATKNALDEQEIITGELKEGHTLKDAAAIAAATLAKQGLIKTTEKSVVATALENTAKANNGKLTKQQALDAISSAVAKTGEATATKGATAAQWSLNAAMEASPVILIVTAIIALVAALALLVVGLVAAANAESEEEKALKAANEELERAKELANQTKQTYENLKNAVSDYKSSTDALAKCTKGTQEWRDAFQEVLDKSNKLIETYPSLLKMSNLFNNDGTLNQETLDKAVENALNSATAAEIEFLKSQQNVAIAKLNKTSKDTRKKLSKEISHNYDDSPSISIGKYTGNQDPNDITKRETTIVQIKTEDIADIIVDRLEKENIKNYYDEEAVSQAVYSALLSNEDYDFLGLENFDNVVEDFSENIVNMGDKFNNLSNETDNTVQALNNASKMIGKNFFGDKFDTDKLGMEAARQEALNNKIEELSDEYDEVREWAGTNGNNAGYSDDLKYMEIGAYSYSSNSSAIAAADAYKEFIDYYGDELGISANKNDVLGDYHGTSKFKFDKEGEKDPYLLKTEDMIEKIVDRKISDYSDEIEKDAQDIYEKEYTNKNQAALAFYENLNFNEAKVSDVVSLNKEELSLNDIFGDDDDLKEKLASKWGIAEDQVETMLNTVKNGFKISLEEAIQSLDVIPDFIKNNMKQGLLDSLNVEDVEKVTKMYTTAIAKSGKEGAEFLNNIAENAGDEADKVMSALGNMDFDKLNLDEANKKLSDLGIQFQLSGEQFYSLKNTMKETSTVTAESAKETYKTVSSVLSKIKKAGDTIEDEDYQKLLAVNPAISTFFTTLADGTHMLTGKAEDFKKAVQSATINELYTAQVNAEETATAYNTLAQGFTSSASLAAQGFLNNGQNFWNTYQDETEAKIKVLKDKDQDTSTYEAQIKNGEETNNMKELKDAVVDVAKAYEELNLTTDDYTEKASAASKQAAEFAESIKETQYQNEISNAGLDYETTENYANVLMEVYEAQGMTKESARNLSIANQRLDKGLSSLNDNFDDWTKSLKNNSKASAEYAETIGEIRTSLANLLNIADADELSTTWIETWMEDSEKMKKVLDGDKEALQEFRESAFTEMTTNVFDNVKESAQELEREFEAAGEKIPNWLTDIKNQLDDGTFSAENLRNAIQDIGETAIGGGASLSQDYVDSLNEMLRQGLLTEQQLNDIFSSIGYKPIVTTKVVSQDTFVPEYTTEEYIADTKYVTVGKGDNKETKPVTVKKSKTYQTGGEYMTQQIPVAQIESEDNATGNIKIVNAGSANITPSYSSTTSGKASESSSTPKTTSAASQDHQVNRYTAEENAINGLTKELERLKKAKDDAFGISQVKAIEKEIEALKKLQNATGNYLDKIVGSGNAKAVAQAIYSGESLGKYISSGQIGGNIKADYQSLFGGASASGKNLEYTAKDDNGNSWLVVNNYSLADLNATFGSSLNPILDYYGNISNKDDIKNEILRLKNQENINYASIADPTGAQETGHNRRIALLEELLERLDQYSDTASKAVEMADNYLNVIQQTQEANANLIEAKLNTGLELSDNTLNRLERALKALGDNRFKSAENMSKYFSLLAKQSEERVKKADAYDEAEADIKRRVELYYKNPLNPDAITPAKAAEKIKEIRDGQEKLYEEEIEYIEQVKKAYGEAVDYYMNKLDKIHKEMDFNVTTLSHLQKVLELTGQSTDYEKVDKVLKGKAQVQEDIYQTRRTERERYEEKVNQHQIDYNKMQEDFNKNKSKMTKQEREEWQNKLDEYKENIIDKDKEILQQLQQEEYSALENFAESLKTIHEKNINKIYSDYEKNVTSGYGFDMLDQSMKNQQSLADEYLTKTNQIYETNKMLRNLNQDIDKINNESAKRRLKAFSDEINALQTKQKLSKNDLELAKARYDILKAQIALEEAKNAKSTVRLQRDSEGNYGYVYTADQDQISNLEQNLEDKENNYYNLLLNQYNDYVQKDIQLKREYAEQRKALDKAYYDDKIINEETYNKLLIELDENFREKELEYQEGMNTRSLELDNVAVNGKEEAWSNGFQKIAESQQLFNEEQIGAAQELSNNIQKEYEAWAEVVETVDLRAGTANSELEGTIKDVTNANKELKKSITDKDGVLNAFLSVLTSTYNLTKKTGIFNGTLETNAIRFQNSADNASHYYEQLLLIEDQQRKVNDEIQNQPSTNYSNDYSQAQPASSSGGDIFGSGNNKDEDTPSKKDSTTTKTFKYYDKDNKFHWKVFSDNSTGPKKSHEFENYAADSSYKICHQCHLLRKKGNWEFKSHFEGKMYIQDKDSNKTIAIDPTRAYLYGLKSGGYTGSWSGADTEENGKLAFLHQKELVLNADDTENVLNAVQLLRQISQTIDLQAAAQSASFSTQAAQLYANNKTLQQEVTIHAEFPNVSDHNEIEQAFKNLVNQASQYANRF